MMRKLLTIPVAALVLVVGFDVIVRPQTSDRARSTAFDIYAAAEQSLVDKVVNEAQYPITLIDEWWPFDPNSRLGDRTYSADEVQQELLSAARIDCSSKTTEKQTPCEIQKAYFAGREQLHNQLDLIRSYKSKAGANWKGPTDSELDDLESRTFPIKEHLAHLKINLLKAPAVKISGIATTVAGVSVAVDAIAETYVEYPVWVCTKTCSLGPIHFCCEGHFEGRWAKVLEFDINDVRFAADGSVGLFTESLVVYAFPSVSRFVLDYPILRDINLAPIANNALSGKRLAILDASKVVAALPYVNTRYQIKSIEVSGNGEIRADIVAQKVP